MEVGKLQRAGREGEQARPARVLLRNEPPQALPFGGHCGLHPRALHRGVSADRKSTRLNSSHLVISYAVFCLKKKKNMGQPSCARGPVRSQATQFRVTKLVKSTK